MFKDYLLKCHKIILLAILQEESVDKHVGLEINFVDLFEEDPKLANLVLKDPDNALQQCDKCVIEAQRDLIEGEQNKKKLCEKDNVHTRIYGLPICPELHRNLFPMNEDLGKFLQVSGTIVRMTAIKMLEHRREYICSKCKYPVTVHADYDQKYIITAPKRCQNPEFCKGTKMVLTSGLDSTHCRDFQEVKIQEQFSKLDVGTMPNTMWVTLEDDLVDMCKPGDSVTICGVVKKRWKPPSLDKKLDIELVLKANHIQVNNDTCSTTLITPEILEQFDAYWEKFKEFPLYGRDMILRSFCPQIYGMYIVKLAIATILAGGSVFNKDENTGLRVRTEPHLLLVGDPGTGKSQLLRFAAKVIPRSVMTTGVGSTSAGLTVTAVMEDGEWQLEGGALVLADGGICCIDEFNSMKEHDRASIHEAMEQQTISVAKASIVCKLRTRCSILASTNPKGPLDLSQPLTINVALASPLLSRFDLILLIKDNVDADWDEQVGDYILRGHKYKSKFFDNKNNSWSIETLQAYFLVIKKLNPKLTKAANKILSVYYQFQRKSENRNKARTTVRLLDSLVRLSQAHARLMYRKKVHVMDAVIAISLIESSMESDDPDLSIKFNAHAGFPDDPMQDYAQVSSIILEKLGLSHLSMTDEGSDVEEEANVNKLSDHSSNNSKTSNTVQVHPDQLERVIDDTRAEFSKNVNLIEVFVDHTNTQAKDNKVISTPFNSHHIDRLNKDNDIVNSVEVHLDQIRKFNTDNQYNGNKIVDSIEDKMSSIYSESSSNSKNITLQIDHEERFNEVNKDAKNNSANFDQSDDNKTVGQTGRMYKENEINRNNSIDSFETSLNLMESLNKAHKEKCKKRVHSIAVDIGQIKRSSKDEIRSSDGRKKSKPNISKLKHKVLEDTIGDMNMIDLIPKECHMKTVDDAFNFSTKDEMISLNDCKKSKPNILNIKQNVSENAVDRIDLLPKACYAKDLDDAFNFCEIESNWIDTTSKNCRETSHIEVTDGRNIKASITTEVSNYIASSNSTLFKSTKDDKNIPIGVTSSKSTVLSKCPSSIKPLSKYTTSMRTASLSQLTSNNRSSATFITSVETASLSQSASANPTSATFTTSTETASLSTFTSLKQASSSSSNLVKPSSSIPVNPTSAGYSSLIATTSEFTSSEPINLLLHGPVEVVNKRKLLNRENIDTIPKVVDLESKTIFDNAAISQNTKINAIRKQFSFKGHEKFGLMGAKSFAKTDSGNFSNDSLKSVFENQSEDGEGEEVDFCL